MSDDLSLERALIEELIGAPVREANRIDQTMVWYFTPSPSLHVTIGPVSIPSPAAFRSGVFCNHIHTFRGNGWLFINCSVEPPTATWPPCTFAEFIEKLRDPKIREACGLKPLEEM